MRRRHSRAWQRAEEVEGVETQTLIKQKKKVFFREGLFKRRP